MPPKKKKSNASKGPARGFATTSVPKKVVPVVEEPPVEEPAEEPEAAATEETASSAVGLDPFQTRLQSLVDRLQDKVDRDVLRAIQTVEVEKRYSETLPTLDLHPAVIERALDMMNQSKSPESKSLASYEQFITKLGATYGKLRRLGFSEGLVLQALQAIPTAESDDACEWIFANFPEDVVFPRIEVPDNSTPSAASASLPASRPASPRPVPVALNINASEFVPGRAGTPTKSSDPPAKQKQKQLQSNEVDDPNAEYVRLMLELDALQETKKQAGAIKALKTRIAAVQKQYFFDEKSAVHDYQTQRQSRVAERLRSRLQQALPEDGPPVSPPERSPSPPPSSPPKEVSTGNDVFDNNDEEDEGGMFGLLEEMPTSGTTEEGVTYIVKDVQLPKYFSGRPPMTLLSDLVLKSDRYAAISYIIISGQSRAVRAKVTVRWKGGVEKVWTMETIACHDQTQAKNYVATMALHNLAFPLADGFATSTQGIAGSSTLFRSLPGAFRDLWDELEADRKKREDEQNREIWGKLHWITETKTLPAQPSNPKQVKPAANGGQGSRPVGTREPDPAVVDHLKSTFERRRASVAYQEMLKQREQLPIARYRQDIVEALERSQVLVLSGETGCGKSTQLPAFLLEDQLSRGQPCQIYCTEPRRISAISLAQRVSCELGDKVNEVGTGSSLVGYSIRLESKIHKNNKLAYVTNGIALRMLEGGNSDGGSAFDEVTHIIVDEVHERTIESDMLLIVLASLVKTRPSLRVVLMSATVDSEKISKYFDDCPTIQVPGRTYPVQVNYLEDVIDLTGWSMSEKSPYARRPDDKFSKKSASLLRDDGEEDDEDEDRDPQAPIKFEKKYSSETISTIKLYNERMIPFELIIQLMEEVCFGTAYHTFSAAILVFMPGMGEIRRLHDMLVEHNLFGSDQFVLYPLHSTLSSGSQGEVFELPPPGVRKIVIATNIAETGITIPDITCVIDTGKHREMRFDEKRQTSRLVETYVAKSNAAQRRGRAGRVQEGVCFHLFTKFRHDTLMAEHPLPEMTRLSLSDLALRIKTMKVNLGGTVEEVLLRGLDPPSSTNIQRAVLVLVEAGAFTAAEEITPLGKLLSTLPTNVHLGKFLLTAVMLRCLDPALTIAATLNTKSPFLRPMGKEAEAKRAKLSFRMDNSDFLTIHNAFSSWRRASANGNSAAMRLCRESFLDHKTLQQIEELRQQFLGYLIDSAFITVPPGFIRQLSDARYKRSNWNTHFIFVPPELDINTSNISVVNAALVSGLYPKILTVSPNGETKTLSNSQVAVFHPSSVNHQRRATELGSKYLAYFTLMHSRKLYAWETAPVDELAILLLCGDIEYKLLSNTVIVDRKLKFRVAPRTIVALKGLRTQFQSVLAAQLRRKPLTESQVLWYELGMLVLGKENMDEGKEPAMSIR
ncbi:P-loop containing nucleoside triphosphate hydrolase protein [Cylindrobasidium torrendii FP15055 ss-10]|uniref:RNA helicase n=1 Tax=Cylindrobasidium torrendii FP15055 ss-10 TaxID=1314674 RepID=A0A0D7BRA4_9AGAR|nr:P-loop containing nucleoside triphosphate hydrolase protein [Cylindrobasidium torrendii FP15055 ss-10]